MAHGSVLVYSVHFARKSAPNFLLASRIKFVSEENTHLIKRMHWRWNEKHETSSKLNINYKYFFVSAIRNRITTCMRRAVVISVVGIVRLEN